MSQLPARKADSGIAAPPAFEEAASSEAQWEKLREALSASTRLNYTQLAELEQAARKISPADLEAAFEVSKKAGDTDASRWFRAELLAVMGQPAAAAELLSGIWESYAGEDRAYRLLGYARALCKSGNREAGARALAEAGRFASGYSTFTAIDRQLKLVRKGGGLPARRTCKIALLGTVSLDFWAPVLRAQCYSAGIDAEIHVAPFGQHQQEILNPESRTAQFRPDVVLLMIDWRSLAFPDEAADPAQEIGQRIEAARALWKVSRERWGAWVIHCNAYVHSEEPYGQLSAALPGGRGRMLRQFNLDLWQAAQEMPGVAILDLDHAAAGAGKQDWANPALWYTARQYPAPQAIPAVTHLAVAVLRAFLGLSAKCVVVDLDGVLWGGVIGEDGLGGIKIGGGPVGEAYAAFQRYLKSLSARGIMLAACSKNNPEDALQPFREHPEMVLREEDFAVIRANWSPKSQNIRDIAAMLNIGLDALVFVDDNPTERAHMRQEVPEVTVIEMPPDPSHYVAALHAPGLFEASALTVEDRKRGESIRANLERAAMQQEASNVDDYLTGLGMVADLAPFNDIDMSRIVQLINKTNQFNLTTRRMNESEVRRLQALEGSFTLTLRLSDRFGDSGLTGVMIAVLEDDALRVHTWLMSCRIMGRRLEEVMLASLVEHAQVTGATRLVGEYLPTAKNNVVADLYPKLGFVAAGGGVYERRAAEGFSPPAFVTVRSSFGTH